MSFIEVHGRQATGPLALQHKNYDQADPFGAASPLGPLSWDLDYRAHVRAVRILGRDFLGTWVVEKDSEGDIIGGQLFKRDPNERNGS